MGHDIYGYRPKEKEAEIAYLRRGAFSPIKNVIYGVLNASDLNGGASGVGERVFKKAELVSALDKLEDEDELRPEREFLDACIANVDENDEILIDFS